MFQFTSSPGVCTAVSEATSHLNANQLSIILAAVLVGSGISTLIAGLLTDWMGRKLLLIILSGILFAASTLF